MLCFPFRKGRPASVGWGDVGGRGGHLWSKFRAPGSFRSWNVLLRLRWAGLRAWKRPWAVLSSSGAGIEEGAPRPPSHGSWLSAPEAAGGLQAPAWGGLSRRPTAIAGF